MVLAGEGESCAMHRARRYVKVAAVRRRTGRPALNGDGRDVDVAPTVPSAPDTHCESDGLKMAEMPTHGPLPSPESLAKVMHGDRFLGELLMDAAGSVS